MFYLALQTPVIEPVLTGQSTVPLFAFFEEYRAVLHLLWKLRVRGFRF